MSGQLQYYQAQFEKFIEQPGVVNDALTFLQKKTQVKKAYIAYGTRLFLLYFIESMACKIVTLPNNFLRNLRLHSNCIFRYCIFILQSF